MAQTNTESWRRKAQEELFRPLKERPRQARSATVRVSKKKTQTPNPQPVWQWKVHLSRQRLRGQSDYRKAPPIALSEFSPAPRAALGVRRAWWNHSVFSLKSWAEASYGFQQRNLQNNIQDADKANFHTSDVSVGAPLEKKLLPNLDVHAGLGTGRFFLIQASETQLANNQYHTDFLTTRIGAKTPLPFMPLEFLVEVDWRQSLRQSGPVEVSSPVIGVGLLL